MTNALIIDGKLIAATTRAQVKEDINHIKSQNIHPALAVILVGDDPASHVYVANKIKACEEVGIKSIEERLPHGASAQDVANIITRLNNDKTIHGILLQLPLPSHIDSDPLVQMIAPEKDVDGLTFVNAGKLVAGDVSGMVPCTPQGSLLLIHHALQTLSLSGDSWKNGLTGKNAVVIGRSLLFGKPMAQLLIGENCTVTTAHSKTLDLPALCRTADILVAAVGRPKMVKGDWVKPGAIVIDVGINRMEDGKLCGDVDYEAAAKIAGAITPVPGGVGPMTIACLMQNTLKAAQNR